MPGAPASLFPHPSHLLQEFRWPKGLRPAWGEKGMDRVINKGDEGEAELGGAGGGLGRVPSERGLWVA